MKNLPVEIIKANITRNRRLTAKKQYVISSEVHVKKGIRLMIDDGVTILIQNGKKERLMLKRAAFIFDQGSALRAKKFQIKACDQNNKPIKYPDNGGLWFIGNYRTAGKDTVKVKANRRLSASSFKAECITTHYLGRFDPLKETTRTKVVQDDIDGISVLGVGPTEWQISEIQSFYSADDGFDLTNSHILLEKIKIQTPTEDGINLSSSYLEILQSLTVNVTKTNAKDRDIFDFETDDSPSILALHSKCKLNIQGVFGDQINLSSSDMPKPNTKDNNERKYKFKGALKRAAMIYSIDKD